LLNLPALSNPSQLAWSECACLGIQQLTNTIREHAQGPHAVVVCIFDCITSSQCHPLCEEHPKPHHAQGHFNITVAPSPNSAASISIEIDSTQVVSSAQSQEVMKVAVTRLLFDCSGCSSSSTGGSNFVIVFFQFLPTQTDVG
jgi:hypothetical protein